MATTVRRRPAVHATNNRTPTRSARPVRTVTSPHPLNTLHPSSRESDEGNTLFPFPVGAVIHGTQGVGKTAICAHLPNVGFVVSKKEKGIRDLVASGQAPEPVFLEVFDQGRDMTTNPPWEELIALNYDISGRSDVENVVFDSMTWIQLCGFRRDCIDNYKDPNTGKPMWGKEGYFAWQQGPKGFANNMYSDFIESLEAIKDGDMNVWLIAHTTVKGHNLPGELSYDRYIPYLDKEVWMQTLAWAQLVLFNNFEATIKPVGDKRQARGRVEKNSQQRVIYTERTEALDAKNRWGLDPVIVCGESGKETYDILAKQFARCLPR